MSKEKLEALEQIKASHKQAHVDSKNIGDFDVWFEDYYNIIEQALIPPTEKEVCDVLSEYYGFEIMYKGLEFFPKERISSLYCVVAMVDGCIDFADPLPLYLITLISRFYEGAI